MSSYLSSTRQLSVHHDLTSLLGSDLPLGIWPPSCAAREHVLRLLFRSSKGDWHEWLKACMPGIPTPFPHRPACCCCVVPNLHVTYTLTLYISSASALYLYIWPGALTAPQWHHILMCLMCCWLMCHWLMCHWLMLTDEPLTDEPCWLIGRCSWWLAFSGWYSHTSSTCFDIGVKEHYKCTIDAL